MVLSYLFSAEKFNPPHVVNAEIVDFSLPVTLILEWHHSLIHRNITL